MNDRNMLTQRIATLIVGRNMLRAFATRLQHVATCWVSLARF